MTETLTREPYDIYTDPNAGRGDTSTDNPFDTERSNNDRHASPTARILERTASLLQEQSELMEQRAINNAPAEALKEYRKRDPEGYTDHLVKLADESNTNEAARSFGQVELDRQDRRESRRESRQEALDKAGHAARRFGRISLNVLGGAALITIGAGMLAAESVGGKVKTQLEKRATRKEAAQVRRQERKDDRETKRNERKEDRQNERNRRARAAIDRRDERRERWSGRREKAAKVYRNTINFGKTQKTRVGRFGRRTHASGKAFVETWKNY